ncbi:Bax inhibitor-1 [Cryptosporidium canis]|uniref:Bax inhibitor-1 n=1 Tax=Cryptosporidium canis TaxID=195482 RepID=A0A9D5DME0_9CRYT|nr:Bax inhibitor-1 [Cryptosporidium canis]
MESFFATSSRKSQFSGNFLNSSDLTSAQQTHLLKMYSSIIAGSFVTVFGVTAFINGIVRLHSFVSFLLGIGVTFYLTGSSSNRSSLSLTRLASFLLLCFVIGNGLGPIILFGNYVNPVIIPTALATTCIIFVSLSFAVLFTKKRLSLYTTSFIFTTIAYLGLVSFFNIFTRSKFVDSLLSYAFVMVYSFYIYYDTQKTLEAVAYGEKDFLLHSIQLYLDAVNLFTRIVVVLIKKHQEEEEKNRKRE